VAALAGHISRGCGCFRAVRRAVFFPFLRHVCEICMLVPCNFQQTQEPVLALFNVKLVAVTQLAVFLRL
jgi:hypothetical protein